MNEVRLNRLNRDGTHFYSERTRLFTSDALCFQSYQYPNLSDGADSVGGQLRGDKECPQTPSIAFRHLSPNSARFGYATAEGGLYISADAVSALRNV